LQKLSASAGVEADDDNEDGEDNEDNDNAIDPKESTIHAINVQALPTSGSSNHNESDNDAEHDSEDIEKEQRPSSPPFHNNTPPIDDQNPAGPPSSQPMNDNNTKGVIDTDSDFNTLGPSSFHQDSNDNSTTVPAPSSSAMSQVPLAEVVAKRNKRTRPDTSRSPGMLLSSLHSLKCLSLFYSSSTIDLVRSAPNVRQGNRTLDADSGLRFQKPTRFPNAGRREDDL